MSRKRSPIWSHFEVCEDSNFATCQECKEQVSRGGNSTKSYNTTNLTYHLSQVHSALHVKYRAEIASKDCKEKLRSSSATSKRQVTLADCIKLDINDSRAQLIHTRIGEMMALDFRPFSKISNPSPLLKTLASQDFTDLGIKICHT